MSELNDAMVEAAARSLAHIVNGYCDENPDWKTISPSGQNKARKDARAILTAALALLPEAEQGWQPIETAPRDGTRFIAGVAGTDDVAVCSRHDPGGMTRNPKHQYECWLVDFSERHQPTHWRPLPAPPPAEGGRKG